MECDFCTEFANPGTESRIIVEQDGWVLLPDIGGFVPGYCLFMPVDHVDAVADAVNDDLSRVQKLAEEFRASVSQKFGPTIIAEHGPRGCDLGAGCCSHAHLHLIPVENPDDVTEAYFRTGGPGTRLRGLNELPEVATGSYLYLSPRPGEHFFWPSAGFSRQYVRQVCATLHGRPEIFDWREHPQPENLKLTYAAMRSALAK